MSYYPPSSNSRKEDQLSSRYTNKDDQLNYRYSINNQNYSSRQERQQLSATTRNISIHKQTALQQQQITDLQRKIDLILLHNQKLQSEKERYRLLYEELNSQNTERAFHSNTARFVTEQNQFIIERLRKELDLSAQAYEQKLKEAYESRKILKDEIQTLSKIIEEVNQENKELKLSIKQQSLKVESLSFCLKEEFIRQQAELQNKLRDEFLIREIELKNQRKQVIEAYQAQVQELKGISTQEKQQMAKTHEEQINILHRQFQDKTKLLSNQMNEQFERQLDFVDKKHRQELKKEQDKAIQYIKENIQNLQSYDDQIKQQYQQEIEQLKSSLQNRKQFINTILAQKSSPQSSLHEQSSLSHQTSWLPELIAIKQQLRQVTTQYLQQSQLLKLKLTEKFEIDVHSLKKIYEDKIELMALQNQSEQQQNSRLRTLYEKSLQNQINAKKDFQLEKGKLRNIIRKLGIQLHGIQQEFKVNIEGIRDQNSAFSMTMMKSMIQVKQKANFYSQENRKLRKAFEEHERQTKEQTNQAKQQVEYFQTNFEKLKQKYKDVVEDLKQKIQDIQQEGEQRQNQLRENLNKQHEMIHSVVQELRTDVQKLTQQNDVLKNKYHEVQTSFKDKDDEIVDLRSLVSQLEADIQRLKLDLSMAGVNDKNHTDTINQWKNHYQLSLSQLQDQKDIVTSKLAQRDQQLAQIIKKYNLLEEQLSKVVKTLKKRSLLEKKVLQMGLDNNLLKNMSELFGKGIQQSLSQN